MNDFLKLFSAAFAGGFIYKAIVYFSDPYEINFTAELFELLIVAGIITLVLVFIKRFQNWKKEQVSK